MKKILKAFFGKKFFAVILLLLQLAVFYFPFRFLSDYAVYIYGGTSAISFAVMLYIINRDINNDIKLTWILLIAIMPIFGTCLYVYVQADLSSAGIKRNLREVNDSTRYLNEDDTYIANTVKESFPSEYGVVSYLRTHAHAPVYKNTYAEYFPLGDNAYPVMLSELKKATKFIFLEYFIINEKSEMWQSILSILREKVHEGVEVRVIYDGMGSMITVSHSFREKMKRYGIKCKVFAPIRPFLSTYQNNRDHRKILVIDGKTAFTGGINIADEYKNTKTLYGHWKDNAIMLKGDSVKSFTLMFMRLWEVISKEKYDYEKYTSERNYEFRTTDDGYFVPFEDNPFSDERVAKSVYTSMIDNSKEYVHIMTPYLVLDEAMRNSLTFAAKRGVDVKILMPHVPDKWFAFALAHTYYPELLRAGVKIYEYTHGFVHAKTTVSDDRRAVVGTVNYDYRSLYLHYECAVYMYGGSVVKDIEDDFEKTVELSKLYTLEDYYSSSVFMRFFGGVLRALATLM